MSPPSAVEGRVVGLHRKAESPGARGLPKPSVPRAQLGPHGVDGDYNRWREETRHGDPDQAVLLLPLEVIEALNSEGWPVRPGDLGENITTRGLPNAAFAVGRQVEVGSACLRVSKPCHPCEYLATLPYVGTVRWAEFARTMTGRRGWFARVERPGSVAVGDAVVLSD